jgi:hypothetical protein
MAFGQNAYELADLLRLIMARESTMRVASWSTRQLLHRRPELRGSDRCLRAPSTPGAKGPGSHEVQSACKGDWMGYGAAGNVALPGGVALPSRRRCRTESHGHQTDGQDHAQRVLQIPRASAVAGRLSRRLSLKSANGRSRHPSVTCLRLI